MASKRIVGFTLDWMFGKLTCLWLDYFRGLLFECNLGINGTPIMEESWSGWQRSLGVLFWGRKVQQGVSKATNVHYLIAKLHNRPSNLIRSLEEGPICRQRLLWLSGFLVLCHRNFWHNNPTFGKTCTSSRMQSNRRRTMPRTWDDLVTNLDSSDLFETRVLATSTDRAFCSHDVVD